ncbi:MAG: hypothetical protein SVX43_13165 [Cyanobacteriota bacterium]|nr:hypothetical protein [Cyanobacteriota bacterium]
MVTENLQDLKTIYKSLKLYERAFIELASLILENTTNPDRIETFAFILDMLAQTMSAERDLLLDLILNWEGESSR